jgi:NAD+ synthase
MTDRLVIALAQLNPVVGDIAGNVRRILDAWEEASRLGADIVVTPELSLSGYPPEDLVLKPFFLDAIRDAVGGLAEATAKGGAALIIGAPWRPDEHLSVPEHDSVRRLACNAALVLDGGKVTSEARCQVPWMSGAFGSDCLSARIFGSLTSSSASKNPGRNC